MTTGAAAARAVLVGISGWHNCGKTVLVEALVRAMRLRGWRVAVIKHAAHGLALDDADSDTGRAWAAGADAVLAISDEELFLRERCGQGTLDEALARLGPGYDVVLVEGFKREPLPRVIIQMAGQKRLDESSAIAVVDCGESGLTPGDPRVAPVVDVVMAWVAGRME